MTQVFISYSRRDLAFVEQLAADLQATSLDVWYDLSGLDGGARWRIEIEKAIRESQYVIVVLSPDSVASEWVEREYLFVGNLKRKIIPLFYKQCDLPLDYLNLHYIDVQGENYKRNYKEILRALGVKTIVQEKPSVPKWEESVPEKPEEEQAKVSELEKVPIQRKWNPKTIIIFFVLAGLILVAVFGLPPLFNPPSTAKITTLSEPSPTATEVITPIATPLPTEITDKFGVEMVLVPAGEFTMGGEHGEEDEKPIHTVYLDSYYIDKYEVTNTLYRACMAAGLCEIISSPYYEDPQYADHPVVGVLWEQAKTFCERRGARLPTEAEWEKAARGVSGGTYPWGEGFACKYANFHDCTDDTTPVGTYELGKSVYGAYDMVGNVWEWVSTLYRPYPYSATDGRENLSTSGNHAYRGGTYWGEASNTARGGETPTGAWYYLGFRCARDANP
jgi:formylglycine-generating enzyme required for sulfatase activity